MYFLKRIINDIKEYSFLAWCIYILNRLITSVTDKISFEHFYLFAIPINGIKTIRLPEFIRKKYQIERTEKFHPFFNKFNISSETIKFRLNQNTVCLLLSKTGEPAGFLWIAQELYQEDIVFCDFIMEKGIAWDFDVVILEKFRKTPAFAVLWAYTFDYLKNKRIDWIYSRINAMNIQSVTVHKKFGGRILGSFIFIKFSTLQLCIDLINMRISQHRNNSRKCVKLPVDIKNRV